MKPKALIQYLWFLILAQLIGKSYAFGQSEVYLTTDSGSIYSYNPQSKQVARLFGGKPSFDIALSGNGSLYFANGHILSKYDFQLDSLIRLDSVPIFINSMELVGDSALLLTGPSRFLYAWSLHSNTYRYLGELPLNPAGDICIAEEGLFYIPDIHNHLYRFTVDEHVLQLGKVEDIGTIPGDTGIFGLTRVSAPLCTDNMRSYILGFRSHDILLINTESMITETIGRLDFIVYGAASTGSPPVSLSLMRNDALSNIVTSNGDMLNDYLQLAFDPWPEQFKISIYSRVGQQVFESSETNFSWPSPGQNILAGLYFYNIAYRDPCLSKKNEIYERLG